VNPTNRLVWQREIKNQGKWRVKAKGRNLWGQKSDKRQKTQHDEQLNEG